MGPHGIIQLVRRHICAYTPHSGMLAGTREKSRTGTQVWHGISWSQVPAGRMTTSPFWPPNPFQSRRICILSLLPCIPAIPLEIPREIPLWNWKLCCIEVTPERKTYVPIEGIVEWWFLIFSAYSGQIYAIEQRKGHARSFVLVKTISVVLNTSSARF